MRTVLYPQADISAEICDVRHDANGVVCKNTDTMVAARADFVEQLCFRYNQISTVFINPYNTNKGEAEMKAAFETGAHVPEVYFPTDRWWNVAEGAAEIMPDYSSTEWTAAGASAFGQTIGAAKATRTPNHGQQLFDISGGVYGFDLASGQPGSSDLQELIPMVEDIEQWFVELAGRKPSAISYRNGVAPSWGLYAPYYLAARNSNSGGVTAWGRGKDGNWLGTPNTATNRQQRMYMNSSIRWADVGNDATANAQLIDLINAVKSNKGFFNNFVHDHSTTHARLNSLFSLVDETIGGTFMWRTSYGEAMQYFWFREMAKSAHGTIIGNDVLVWVDYIDDFRGTVTNGIPNDVLLDRIKTPLSVKIDLTGTPLAGKQIKTSYGRLISLGGNQYIVEVPFVYGMEGVKGVRLTETANPDYYNFSKPTISVTVTDGIMIVTTNRPTKAVLFGRNTGSSYVTATVRGRSNKLSYTHSFPIVDGVTYNVGAITRESVLNLSGDL